jgi:hypothetical protein
MRPARFAPAVVFLILVGTILSACGSTDGSEKEGSASTVDPEWLVPPRPIQGLHQRTVGNGTGAAVLLWNRGADPPRDVVIFLHGALALPPFAYGEWIKHLARTGNTVIYPAYLGNPPKPSTFLPKVVSGVATGLRAVDADREALIAVGETTGGALAFDLAAVAAERGIPAPRGVLAAYPGRNPEVGEVKAADLSQIAPETRLRVVAGPGDPLPDGEAQARALLDEATNVPRKERRYLSAPRGSVPSGRDPGSRQAFWLPLDRLIAEVRGSS